MPVFTFTETMLYCPKCQQTYEDGSQRFCSNEGERLLHSNDKPAADAVFAEILSKTAPRRGKGSNKSRSSKFGKIETKINSHPAFSPPPTSKIFKAEPETEHFDSADKRFKSTVRIIKPGDIPNSRVKLGERKTGDAAASEAPLELLNQTIDERYYIVEKIGEDEATADFLAEDKTDGDRKVLFKVLKNEKSGDAANEVLAEERVSLAQINHPNLANIIGSGALTEGFAYLVTEYVQGKSIKELLNESGQFDARRAAGILRRAADAVGEAHAGGVLHRNLTPDSLILTADENGAEQVKVTGFGVSKGELNKENIHYKSPEQIERQPLTYESDVYSLGAIACRMLTNRFPFKATSKKDFLQAQREGLTLLPSDLRFGLSPVADKVLQKALAFEQTERFAEAIDFGNAIFEALTADSIETKAESEEKNETVSAIENARKGVNTNDSASIPATEIVGETKGSSAESEVKTVKDFLWEKRSPEPPIVASKSRYFLAFVGLAALLVGLFAAWYYFINRAGAPVQPAIENFANKTSDGKLSPNAEEIEVPPNPRSIKPPAEAIYFENSKEHLKGAPLRNFLGFSLYYPKSWTRNEADNRFLDVSKKSPAGIPVEQMLVGFYESNGTFKIDREKFPALVENSNKDLKKIIPNYQTLSEGEIKINGGWKAYEVKFQGGGATEKGDKKLILWGRRLWIPAARPGVKNGYVITMLATSLSPDVQSVDDVGVKGDLASVLETFEPNQNY